MRVAVCHTDADHPNGQVAAYRFGRVQAQSDPLTGEAIGADQLMVALLDQARKEFPEKDGYRVWPERLEATDGELGEADSEAEWREVDEDALRERAKGEPVDVATIQPRAKRHVKATASQSSKTKDKS